jgi:hypothetical protein
MTSPRRWFARASLAFTAGLVVFGTARPAAALLNVGLEGGLAKRTETKVGPAWGAHAELNPILGLHVGPYFFYSVNDPSDSSSAFVTRGIRFTTVGGRVRYIFDFLGKDFMPYAFVGLGYTSVSYPGIPVPGTFSPVTSQTAGNTYTPEGSFMEVPLGLGIAHTAFKVVQFDLGAAWRPGTTFRGNAYEGNSAPATKPSGGFSVTLGASFAF